MRIIRNLLISGIFSIVGFLITDAILDHFLPPGLKPPTVKGYMFEKLKKQNTKPGKTKYIKPKPKLKLSAVTKSATGKTIVKPVAIKQDSTKQDSTIINPKDTAITKYFKKFNAIKQIMIKAYLKTKNQDTVMIDKKNIHYIEAEKLADSLIKAHIKNEIMGSPNIKKQNEKFVDKFINEYYLTQD
jgi:hypothetical protein